MLFKKHGESQGLENDNFNIYIQELKTDFVYCFWVHYQD